MRNKIILQGLMVLLVQDTVHGRHTPCPDSEHLWDTKLAETRRSVPEVQTWPAMPESFRAPFDMELSFLINQTQHVRVLVVGQAGQRISDAVIRALQSSHMPSNIIPENIYPALMRMVQVNLPEPRGS